MTPRLLACVSVLLLVSTAARASPPPEDLTHHIRTTDQRLRALLQAGLRESPTLQALVTRLVGSDVVVYLRCDRMGPSRIGGRLTFLTAAGGLRYLVVRLRHLESRAQQIALLAHELQHAVEIAGAPAVVDAPSLMREYRRIGYTPEWADEPGQTFDTDAAVRAGVQVLTEILGLSEGRY